MIDKMKHFVRITAMTNESFISLVDAANAIAAQSGRKIHWRTIRRWVVDGLKGVKLAAARIGGRWFTKLSWLDEFNRKCTQSASGSASHVVIKRESYRKADMEFQRSLGIYGNEVD